MSTSVLPLARAYWVFQLIGASVAVTAAVLLGAAAAAGVASPLYLPLALIGLVMFGVAFTAAVQALATDGLTLGEHALGYSGRVYRWSDVADFTPVGFFAKSHVRVVLRTDAQPSRRYQLAAQLGRLGLFDPAIHIPVRGYRTGGEPLAAVLERRRSLN